MSASGQLTNVKVVAESSYGVPSGTTYKALRVKDTSLNLKKGIFQSAEIRSDRQKSDARHGMRSVAGDISVELGLTTFDDMIEAALAGTFVAVTTGSISLASTTGTNTITRTVGSFITDGFLPGDEVLIAGFATGGNNGRTKILTVAALTITVAKALASDVAAAARTVDVVGKRVKCGNTMKTMHVQRAFTDIAQFLLFKGCAVDQLKLSAKPDAIVEMVLSVLGKDVVVGVADNAAVTTPAATNSPFDVFSGVLQEGGTALAYVTGLDLQVSNNRAVRGVIGSNTPQEVFEGQAEVSGTLTAMFQDASLLNKFLNETGSSLDVKLNDPNGTDFHRIRIPNVKYTGGDLDNPKDGPVIQTLPFVGLLDATAGTSLLWQRSNT